MKSEILVAVCPLISAVLVAILNNWDKINPNKRHMKDILTIISAQKDDISQIKKQFSVLESAQRTGLQTAILEKCREIQIAIDTGEVDYSEQLKQLIILYKEYYKCGFNSQGKLYFNDTIEKASQDNNILVRDLMNTYFSEYNP